MGKRALVDMDLIVYRIGHACDNRYYEYCGERYEDKRALDKLVKEAGIEDPSAVITTGLDPEDWSEVQETVVGFVENLLEGYVDFKGFISGQGNFRYDIATILPYKGNRTAERPTHYDAIRQLLVDMYGATIVPSVEADDAIGLEYSGDSDVILSLDKDLDMIPGNHYNWERDIEYKITELQGYKNFFKQLLLGDTSDNILGLYGVGPKSALLKAIESMENVGDMYNYVLSQYESRFGSYAKTFLVENSKLLWILQRDRCNPIVEEEYWLQYRP